MSWLSSSAELYELVLLNCFMGVWWWLWEGESERVLRSEEVEWDKREEAWRRRMDEGGVGSKPPWLFWIMSEPCSFLQSTEKWMRREVDERDKKRKHKKKKGGFKKEERNAFTWMLRFTGTHLSSLSHFIIYGWLLLVSRLHHILYLVNLYTIKHVHGSLSFLQRGKLDKSVEIISWQKKHPSSHKKL